MDWEQSGLGAKRTERKVDCEESRLRAKQTGPLGRGGGGSKADWLFTYFTN